MYPTVTEPLSLIVLDGAEHSAVFLTEKKITPNGPNEYHTSGYAR